MTSHATRSAKLRNVFVGKGHFDLCLRISELIELQESLNTGPFKLAERFAANDWTVQDIKETLRLALIGGGSTQKDAWNLVESCVTSGYLIEYADIAHQALIAAVFGVDDEIIDEEASDGAGEQTTPTD